MEKPPYYRKIFDSFWLSHTYDAHVWISALGKTSRVYRIATEPLKNPKTLVDFATGTGSVLAAAHKRFPGAKLIGIDLSERMMRRAAEKVPAARLLQRDIADCKLPAASADAITLSFAIHDVPAPVRVRVIREAHRVLRKGGTFVVVEYRWPAGPLLQLAMLVQFALFEHLPAWSIFSQDLPAELKKAGFSGIATTKHLGGACVRHVARA